KGGGGGRGVKEKHHNVSTGLVNESGNGGANEHRNVGLESSSNVAKNSAVNKEDVANVNVTSSTDGNLIMAGYDNMHDKNAGRHQVTLLLIRTKVLLMLIYLGNY
nr:hypothetical protein [Tanacetum cinerariifolium]